MSWYDCAMVCLCDQVALMRVVDSAMAALDAHRGVSGVAKNGLGFLRNMASAGENRVGCIVCSGQG